MSRVVFDIGGTNMRVAYVVDERLCGIEKIKTPRNPEQGVEIINTYIKKIGVPVTEIVGGIAGTVQNGTVLFSEHLPKWNAYEFTSVVKEICGVQSVQIFNDAEIAGIGEARIGAGKNHCAVAYMVFSTGVGGAIIVDGKPVPHAIGYEPGKQIIDYVKMLSLEDMVCGASLENEFGISPKKIPRDIFLKRTHIFAVGLYNVLRLWSPDILVIGGALMNDENGYSLDAVIRELSALSVSLPVSPLVVPAILGDENGLQGAMLIEL